jgi:dTDP-4-amino-4,6-dideoxygalactose transaminase
MIPFYKANCLSSDLIHMVKEQLQSGQLTNFGPACRALEARISEYVNRPACMVASGTHALTIALILLQRRGVLPERARILIPSFTFFATMHAVLWANMIPVFADIYEDDFTIDIKTAQEEYDAIMPVNIFGVQHHLLTLDQTDVPVIGDLSHGFGGDRLNIKNGSLETVACFSTSVTKPFQTVEGGIIIGDQSLIDEVKIFRNWGNPGDYNCVSLGQWSKISELHCAVGLESFKNLQRSIDEKHGIAHYYQEHLEDVVSAGKIRFQEFSDDSSDIYTTYKDFAVIFNDFGTREKVTQALLAEKIDCKKYFYPQIHKMKCFKGAYDSVRLPITEKIADTVLCLPIYDTLQEYQIEDICDVIKGVL